MRNLILFAILALGLAFSSCQKPPDPCDNVICLNNGTCINGTCDCPIGYTGSDCSVILTPDSMHIDTVLLRKFPTTRPDGTNWDDTSLPDILLTFRTGLVRLSNTNTSGTYRDIVTPFRIHFNTTLHPLHIVDSLYIDNWIGLWEQNSGFDSDPRGLPDFMGDIKYNPSQYMGTLPRTIILSNADIEVTLYVTWCFL